MSSASLPEETYPWRVHLLERWALWGDGVSVAAPMRVQRLVAILAVQGEGVRGLVAGLLWPETSEVQALSSLRTAVRQTHALAPGLVTSRRDTIGLSPGVGIDIEALRHLEGRAMAMPEKAAHEMLAIGELLPGWYDDWVLLERERLHQVRLNVLNSAALSLLDKNDLPLALAAAQECVAMEPLRESSHRTLVQIQLASGDRLQAFLTYQSFRRRSIEEFGLAPGPSFERLVAPLNEERASRALRARSTRPTRGGR